MATQYGLVAEEGEDPDVALAKLLQEQEHAWSLASGAASFGARAMAGSGSLSASDQTAGQDACEDDDRGIAERIQEEEYRAHVRELLGGVAEDQAVYESVDVDNMSYEELQALGESLGRVQVPASAGCLEGLETARVSEVHNRLSNSSTCSVCQQEHQESDMVVRLPCSHWFHKACVFQWLQTSKACPVCMRDVEK